MYYAWRFFEIYSVSIVSVLVSLFNL